MARLQANADGNGDAQSAEQRYAAVVAALIDEPDVTRSAKRGFGFGGLHVGGKLFAILRGEELLLKLPAAKVAMLIASGEGHPFDAGRGRPMKEWVTAEHGAGEGWPELARQAMLFVARAGRA